MDFRQFLGCKFDDLPIAEQPHSSSFDDGSLIGESESRWAVSMIDGSMSLWLTKDRIVSTIFLHSRHLIEEQIGLPEPVSLIQVLAKFGIPSRSGEPQQVGILGPRGEWVRYDDPHHCMHIEFQYMANSIHCVTLMERSVAP
jgi:hypothetical protein